MIMGIFSDLFGSTNTETMSSSDWHDVGQKLASSGLVSTPPPIEQTPLTSDQYYNGLLPGINNGINNNSSY
jgi:hypothetical protein